MEVGKGKDEKLALVHEALRQLLEERKQKGNVDDVEDDEDRLLSKLLSKLDNLEKDVDCAELRKDLDKHEQVSAKTLKPTETPNCETKLIAADEMSRELKKIFRQNFITHCLLSALIIVTAAWQLSEVSFLLSVKETVTNPFKTLGGLFKRVLNLKAKKLPIEVIQLPPISVPEVEVRRPLVLHSDDED